MWHFHIVRAGWGPYSQRLRAALGCPLKGDNVRQASRFPGAMSVTRWGAVIAVLLAAFAIMASMPSTAAADGPTTLERTDWQAMRPYAPVATPHYGQHGHINYYNHIPGPVPTAAAAGWTSCGAGNPLCPNAETIGMSLLSRLGGFACLQAADFTFFQSFVSIPEGTSITQFSVNMSGADDGARVAIYNSAYPGGFVFPGSYIYLGGAQSTTDLSAAMVPGEVNRVVITQMDDCYSGNNLAYAQIFLNGTVVPPPPTDATAPSITAEVAGTLGDNDWYVSDIDVSWIVTDDESAVTETVGCDAQTITTDTAGVTLTCTATSAGGTATESVVLKRDATAPEATATRTPDANAAGWNQSPVTVSFSGSDALSGVAACDPDVVLGEGAGQSASGTCTDYAGNVSAPAAVGDINVDLTAPVVTVTGVTDGATYTVGAAPAAGCDTTDALSGVATAATVVVTGGPLGAVTVTCDGAADVAGNVAAAVVATYTVAYDFCGFEQPLLAPVQVFKIRSTIPVKFCVQDAAGQSVSTATAEVYANGVLQGTARYADDGAHYIFQLRTKGMSAGPLTIEVRLDDGSTHAIEVALR